MSFSTFSGPLRAGTVRQGSGENTGVVLLGRSTTVSYSAMTTSPSAQTICTIPAGSKILKFIVEVTTAISGGSVSNVGVTFGVSGGTANYYVTTFNTGLTSVKVPQATIDAAMVVANTNNVGASDVTITGTFTAATGNPTAGAITVTVEYLQRGSTGSYVPTNP